MSMKLIIFLILINANLGFAQIPDSDKIQNQLKHTFLFTLTGPITSEYRLTYKYAFYNHLSVVYDLGYKYDRGIKSSSGCFFNDLILTNNNTGSTIGSFYESSLRIEFSKRKVNISQGLYFRHSEIDSVTYSNCAGTTADYAEVLYSEKAQRLGVITQLALNFELKVKRVEFVIEPYYRLITAFPISGQYTEYGNDHVQYYSEPQIKKPKTLILSYIGINIGVKI